MTTSIHWGLIALAFGVGAVLGGMFTWRKALTRFNSRLHSTTTELRNRHESDANELRAAQLRAQSELDQARQSFKRQLAAAAAGPRAAALKAEERLRAAYDDLDRLRRAARHSAAPDSTDGFAATRPMPESL